jgi:5'-3' exonuclease
MPKRKQPPKKTEDTDAPEEPSTPVDPVPVTPPKPVFSPLQITPGTSFMNRLKNALCYYACCRLASGRFGDIKFYISGIFKFLKTMLLLFFWF